MSRVARYRRAAISPSKAPARAKPMAMPRPLRPLLVALLIGLAVEALFLWGIATPHKLVFDEVHYVPAARALLELSGPVNAEHRRDGAAEQQPQDREYPHHARRRREAGEEAPAQAVVADQRDPGGDQFLADQRMLGVDRSAELQQRARGRDVMDLVEHQFVRGCDAPQE